MSVVLPVYNRADLVGRALQSVLEQTYEDFEVVFLDDGSTDDVVGFLSKIEDRRIRLVSLDRNRGAAASRNAGLSAARGQYIALIDSDDFWFPKKLERQLAFMGRTQARMSCTASKVFSRYQPRGEVRGARSPITERDMASGCRISPGSTLMAEKSLFAEVGPMNEDMARLEDWDWLLRALKSSELLVLNEVLSIVDRRHEEKINYDAVRDSVRIMRARHFSTSGLLPSTTRLNLLAALENELAAVAYQNARFELALWHLLKSLYYFPYRSLDTIQRISSAVLWDCLRLVR